ncbi:MAG: EVE domain-containing protein [Chloroflexi bacterium]|nr:EVE domain-containing protein [Chloroflexota bacterium]
MGKTYWMLVTTQENLDITRARGFDLQGVDTRNRRKAVRMGPEDRVLYYVSDKKGFAATATVTSESFEDNEPIWKHHREHETFPHRVEIEPDVVLDEGNYVDGYEVGPTLEYVRKWPPDRWHLAFFGMLHIIPQRDFNYVEDELKRVNGSLEQPESDVAEPDASESKIAKSGPEEPSSKKTRPPGSSAATKKRAKVARKNRKTPRRRKNKKRR